MFHPILVTSFLVVFGKEVTKILCNSLFIFHFVLPIFPCKQKRLYRKSRNLTDEKPKNEVTKICDEPGNQECYNGGHGFGWPWSKMCQPLTNLGCPNWRRLINFVRFCSILIVWNIKKIMLVIDIVVQFRLSKPRQNVYFSFLSWQTSFCS